MDHFLWRSKEQPSRANQPSQGLLEKQESNGTYVPPLKPWTLTNARRLRY